MKYKISLFEGDELKYSGYTFAHKYGKRKIKEIIKQWLSVLIAIIHINNKT